MSDGLSLGRQSVLPAASGRSAPAAGAFAPAMEKYTVEGAIGRGGMGEILLVTDHDLRRQVAMKVLREEVAQDEEARLHFVAEAQATSQLEHPGIPPVHDIGVAPDGRLYFTMKLVRGRTLREIVHDLFVMRPEMQKEWTLHRLVGVVERLCETLHFAHERGVMHRDVKPENVMLGDYGEVHMMDWGLARVAGETAASPDAAALETESERVSTARTDAALATRFGDVKGTVPYMAPEQLDGRVDRRTDVYAVGLVLYEVLTLRPAFDPHEEGLIRKVASADVPAVETRNPRRAVPLDLAEVCRKATAKDPAARFQTAAEMAARLRAWLDGSSERERRHREAEAFASRGIAAAGAYRRAKDAATNAEAEVARRAAGFEPWQRIDERLPLFEARKGLKAATRDVALAFAEALKWFDAALVQEDRNVRARAALADLWKGRLGDAERRSDEADAEYALDMVKRYDDGALAAFVKGDGSLTLESEPPGAEVLLSRYVERAGVLVPAETRSLGRTPVGPVPLAMGSYLCVFRRAGTEDVRYPVHISRNRSWVGRVRLRTAREIGEEFVYVPGGPFVYGEGKATRTVELEDFAIGRHPVTFGEYAEFLAVVERDEGLAAAVARAPHGGAGDAPYMVRDEDGAWSPRPDFIGGAPAERCLRDHGPGWMNRLPVMAVSFDDAVAYCAFRTKTTGREWRLPTEEEREKAARGVDGRRFPWGDLEDATLGKCRESRPEEPDLEPVGAFPTAESVYGMDDAAGGVWDWTDSWFDARRSLRVLRGGSWYLTPVYFRCANRNADAPWVRIRGGGFRCARSL